MTNGDKVTFLVIAALTVTSLVGWIAYAYKCATCLC